MEQKPEVFLTVGQIRLKLQLVRASFDNNDSITKGMSPPYLYLCIVSLGETGQQNSAAESDVSSERAVGSRGICRRWVDDQKPAPKETVQLCTCDA